MAVRKARTVADALRLIEGAETEVTAAPGDVAVTLDAPTVRSSR